MTNFERITKSPEELAHRFNAIITQAIDNDECPFAEITGCTIDDCDACITSWLKQKNTTYTTIEEAYQAGYEQAQKDTAQIIADTQWHKLEDTKESDSTDNGK